MSLEQIDAGLARLHVKQKEEYNEGTFKDQCTENGLDFGDIMEELNGDDVNGSLIDADFVEGICPWLTGDGRMAAMFEILKKCANDSQAFSGNFTEIKVTSQHFGTSQDDINKALKKAQEQAPSIVDHKFSQDEALLRILAVSMKIDPSGNYLVFLADMFQREILYNHYKNRKGKIPTFQIGDWKEKNAHMKELKNLGIDGNKKADDIVKAAIASYLHRVAPKLMLVASNRIDYDLEAVARFVEQTVTFVHNQAKENMSTCPFQYDAVFAFKKSFSEVDGAEEDEEDDDDDDEDDEKGFTESKVPDVKEVLGKAKLNHTVGQWDKPDERFYRPLKESFNDLQEKAKKEQPQFPQFSRFCSIMDFRAEEKDDNLFVFEPEDGSKKIHSSAMALNFFQNSQRSLLPDPDAKPDDDIDNKQETQHLTARSTGPQFMLSFQVEAEDSIRCYLYINGQCTRFLPEDLKMLLPNFFKKSDANDKFAESKTLAEMAMKLTDKMKDDQFRAFLRENKVHCPFAKEMKEAE